MQQREGEIEREQKERETIMLSIVCRIIGAARELTEYRRESLIMPVEIDIFGRTGYPTTLLKLRIPITIIFTTATNGENGVVGDLRIIPRLY